MIRLGDALGVEVLADLAEHVAVGGLLEIREHDFLGIGLRFVAGEAELVRRPQAEHLVAPGHGLELQFLIERELLLESFLALVERCHCALAAGDRAPVVRARTSLRLEYRAKMTKSTPVRRPQRRITRVRVRRLCSWGRSVRLRQRTGRWLDRRVATARSCAAEPESTKATARNGFPQATVHSDEPPPPHL